MTYKIQKYSINDKYKYIESATIKTERNLTFKDMIDYIYTEFFEEVSFMGGYYDNRYNSMVYVCQGRYYKYLVYIKD